MNLPVWVPVLIIVVFVALTFLLMWRGWQRRSQRDAGLAELPSPAGRTAGTADRRDVLLADVPVRYLGTTTSGDWLDRVVAHDLGRRARGTVRVGTGGLTVEREAEQPLFVPAATLRAARLDRAGGGRATRKPEYVIFTWEHDGRVLDTTVRPAHRQDRERLLAAVTPLTEKGPS